MKIVFASVFAFDANISLINELKKDNDVYFITEALYEVHNYLNREKLTKIINFGTSVEQLTRFKDLLNLEKTYVIKGVRNSNLFRKIYNSIVINNLIKKIDPDILLLDNCVLTYIISALFYRKKSFLIVHDPFMHSNESNKIDGFLRMFFFKLIKNKILLNFNQKQKFINSHNFTSEEVDVSFLSVYNFLTYFGSKKSRNKDKFKILFFGRISQYKGIKYLLEAFEIINQKEENNNFTLTIAGSGEFDFDITTFEKKNNIEIINRYIDVNELSELIFESSVIVCPYIDATQSGVVMSAYAFGKPVIATNVGGLPEMVLHNITGIIVEPKNANQLAEAIIYLFNNPEILNLLSDNIKNIYIEGERSWKKSAGLIQEIFQRKYNKNS